MKRVGVICLLLIALTAYAGVTGKIAGRIVDSQTREPLPGVNVVIQGTELGGATDPGGQYYIINVPVGSYAVTASMVGYEPVTKTGIKVSADLTQIVDFGLRSTVIEVKGVVISGERPIVTRDATATYHIVAGSEIDRQPVNQFQEVVAQQAGVVNSEGGASGATAGLHLRGGRADETAYMVDGMSIKDPITGTPGANVNTTAIEEMSVITGGFNAEYGQAMSGVVNLVTKEGKKFSGTARVHGDQLLPGPVSYQQNNLRLIANIGGPLTRYVRYFLSAQADNREHDRAFGFDAVNDPVIKTLSNTLSQAYSVQGKLTFNILPALKLNLSGFQTRNQAGMYNMFVGLPGLDQRSENDWKYAPDTYRNYNFRKARQLTAAITHQVSPATFYDLRYGWFDTRTIRGHLDQAAEQTRRWWQDVTFRDWWWDVEGDYVNDAAIGWAWGGVKVIDSIVGPDTTWHYDTASHWAYPYGVPQIFRLGSPGYWEMRRASYHGGVFNLTSQINPHHELKFGAEGRVHHVTREEGQYLSTGFAYNPVQFTSPNIEVINGDSVYVDTVFEVGGDTIILRSPIHARLQWLPPRDSIVVGPQGDTTRLGSYWTLKDALYFDLYNERPYEFAFFLQDKIEYESFVIAPGIRFDYFDSRTWRFNDPLKPYKKVYDPEIGDSVKVLDTTMAKPKWQVSPRFGIAFPVSDRTVFHVSYGHFFQMSRVRWLYDGYNNPIQAKRGGWGLTGNPDLEAERTIQYEIGIAQALTPDMALTATAFYKDLFNLIGARFIAAIPDPYTAYVTQDYGNVRGLELVLSKRANEWLSGQVSYTIQYAQGTSSYEREAYYDYISNVPVDPFTGLPYVLPKIDYPLEFDQRHTFAASLDYTIPAHRWGPFQNTTLSTIISLGSGLPYTVRNNRNEIVGVVNAQRMPWSSMVDLKLTKRINLGGVGFDLIGEVSNLFNIRNIQNLYPNTGKLNDNALLQDRATYLDQTWPTSYAGQDRVPVYPGGGISTADPRRDFNRDGYVDRDEWYSSYVRAYKDWTDDPFMLNSPRRIMLGVSFSW